MYSDEDIDGAVSAGALTAEAATGLRAHIAARRIAGTEADDENFRLIGGFNDVFVTIACLLVLFAAAFVFANHAPVLAGVAVAAVAWAVAEVFTRRRRMALPSIVLLIAFVGGVAWAAGAGLELAVPAPQSPWGPGGGGVDVSTYQAALARHTALLTAIAGLAGALAAAAHWRRFRVPITIAAGVAAVVAMFLGLVTSLLRDPQIIDAILPPLALACGLAVFAYAMRWDLTDPQRRTHRSDIAFWLHLVAAPLIAHPLFHWLGVTDNTVAPAAAVGVLVLYVAFAVVALTVDRRSLLVSALVYVLWALAALFRTYGSVETGTAATAFVVGASLLTLSALWARARRQVLARLPADWVRRLPPAR